MRQRRKLYADTIELFYWGDARLQCSFRVRVSAGSAWADVLGIGARSLRSELLSAGHTITGYKGSRFTSFVTPGPCSPSDGIKLGMSCEIARRGGAHV